MMESPLESTELKKSEGVKTDPMFFSEAENTPTYEFFIFELDGTFYAVSVSDVDQVIKIPPITTVPNAPDFILGIFHLRGRVIVAIDLLKRMGLGRKIPLSPYYLFVAHLEKNYFAVLIDRIHTVIRIPVKEIVSVDPLIAAHLPPRYTKGMFMYLEQEPKVKKVIIPDIMIKPAGAKKPEPEKTPRPVLWLNVEELLNQKDLLEVTEKTPEPVPTQPA